MSFRLVGPLPEFRIEGLQRAGAFCESGLSIDLDWTDSADREGVLAIKTGAIAWSLAFRLEDSVAWSQTIAIGYVRCTYGRRAHWICPTCFRRCSVLFEREARFACRQCQGLRYRSQRQSKLTRALEQAQDLNEQLGRKPHELWDPITVRPSGMRWSRFRCLSRRFLARRHTASVLINDLSKRFWAEREGSIRVDGSRRRRVRSGDDGGLATAGSQTA